VQPGDEVFFEGRPAVFDQKAARGLVWITVKENGVDRSRVVLATEVADQPQLPWVRMRRDDYSHLDSIDPTGEGEITEISSEADEEERMLSKSRPKDQDEDHPDHDYDRARDE